jgi:uncharacterized surface protein with fasciclin (FAS1) repeats
LPVILPADKLKQMSNIAQLVNVEKNMTTLKKTVLATGLDQVLSGKGPFTVFAPSDNAFGKLDKSVIENLLKPENKTKLTDLLNHHVVAGKINFKDLKDGEKLKTVNGRELIVHMKDGNATVDGAKIQGHDVEATNGVIHTLDSVMLKN